MAQSSPEYSDRFLDEPSAPPTSVPRPAPGRESAAQRALRPGLLPGLDEFLCARLWEHGVRNVQRLMESSCLTLARRSGIPYSKLLELSRAARRAAAPPAVEHVPEERVVELKPRAPWRTPLPLAVRASAPEPVRSDEFTLPLLEPESAGPFVS
jgi:hypothetical protein